jgi:phosphoglycerate kinase
MEESILQRSFMEQKAMTMISENTSREAITMSRIPRLQDQDVKGKIVLLRADLNVPADHDRVSDASRLIRLRKTVAWILQHQGRIILMSHFGRPEGKIDPKYSLAFLVPELSRLYQTPVAFVDQYQEPEAVFKKSERIILLENLRFDPGEEENNITFAKKLADMADLYVNDAFSVSHRAHASIEAITKFLPSSAGFLLQEEVEALSKALEHPVKPVIAVVGGSKISSKLTLLYNLVEKVDYLIPGGGMANTFLAAQGMNIGASLCEDDMIAETQAIMKKAQQEQCEILLPRDVVVSKKLAPREPFEVKQVGSLAKDDKIFDIGAGSISDIEALLGKCKTLLWNGPLGVFEVPPFDLGTTQVALCVARLTRAKKIESIAGGGDTVSALNHAEVTDDFTYVSTAGGAFLEWCEGKSLPGVQALIRS